MKTTESSPDVVRQFFLEENPNPERVGCPPEKTLQAAAENRLPVNDPARLHMANCSECFAEYRGYRLDWQRKQTARRRLIGWAVAAGLLVAAGGGALAFRHHLGLKQAPQEIAHNVPPAPPQAPGPIGQTSTAPPADVEEPIQQPERPTHGHPSRVGRAVPAVLDLALSDAIYGRDKAEKRLLSLRNEKLNLSVLLPQSSEPGKYDIRLAQDPEGHKVLASASGDAVKRNRRVSLVIQLPLQGVVPGSYFLFIEKSNDGEPKVYDIRVIAGTSHGPHS